MAKEIMLYQVDAFAETKFKGNPAGVCVLPGPADEQWMQQIAGEMNLSETAFVIPKVDRYAIRYFTPETEVPLCGHATLASAHILYESAIVQEGSEILFEAPNDLLKVRKQDDWIAMKFPKDEITCVTDAGGLLDELRIDRCEEIFRSRFDYHIVLLNDPAGIRDLSPDLSRMKRNGHSCVVTAKSDENRIDFVSRFFAPPVGIDEDPVTGIAHSTLGQYWADRLGRKELTGKQISRRTGLVRVQVDKDFNVIMGKAITVFKVIVV